jgi:peptide deformylase
MPTNIILIDDPILRVRCDEVPTDSLLDMYKLLEEMHSVMLAEQGIGLAANQIGRSLRIFILKDNNKPYRAFINPEILAQSELVDFENEGCLSIPGTFGTTKRYRVIRLKWTDLEGRIQEEDFMGMEAFAVQHEMDHLNGKLYIDQFGPLKKEMVVKKHRKFMKRR